jgi:hypothetical protein
MVGRDGKKQVRRATAGRRLVVGMGAGVGVFFAAAAMATGSAAPAKADFEDLVDPIIQPILTSLTDSIGAFDPAAALDLTSWTDSFLASLNSIDLAVPAASEPAAAVAAASPASDPVSGTYDIPITVQEDTEPTVQAAIGSGPDQTLLVDTGSSGIVIPWQDLGSNDFTALENLFALGSPSSPYIGESGYSGGVDYIYLTYNDATVNYGDGALTTTNTPIDVEIFSFPTSFSSPADFQTFLSDNDSTGILGIGSNDSGPTESPLQADGFNGVLVDLPQNELIVTPTNPLSAIATVDGAPISSLTESVNGGTPVAVSDDIDSGGVYGTIPSSLLTSSQIDNSTDPVSVAPGNTVTVYDGNTELYSYVTGTDSDGTATGPTPISGTDIDSGVIPFEQHPIYIDYGNDTLTFDK